MGLKQLQPVIRAGMMGWMVLGAAIAPANANPILSKWTFEPSSNSLEIVLTEDIKPRYYLLARPARVVLDLPGTTLGTGKILGDYPGAVRRVQVSQPEPELTRLVLELAPDAVLAPEQVALKLLEGNVVPNRFRWSLQPLIEGRLLPPVQPGEGTKAGVGPRSPAIVPLAPDPIQTAAAPKSAIIQVATPAIDLTLNALSFEKVVTESPSLQASNPAADSPMVTVPPLVPRNAPNPSSAIAETAASPNSQDSSQSSNSQTVPVIEFGQPLPWGTAQPSSVLIRPSGNPGDVLLPAGTLLNLRYPGTDTLNLRSTPAQQDVLLLQTEVRDPLGRVLIPVDSRVIGRFETHGSGSRFVARALLLSGRNLPLRAESEVMTGDRAVQPSKLAINSGIGAIAGGVLGKGSGATAVGGAAAGAALTYLTAPKPADIVPGQMLQVRLLEDLR